MKDKEDRSLLLLIIFLPLILSLALDITPYSKSIQSYWKDLKPFYTHNNLMQWRKTASVLLRHQPWQIVLWERMARVQYEAGEFEGVIVSLEEVEKVKPLTIDQMMQLGFSYLKVEQTQKAYAIWEKIVTMPDISVEHFSELFGIQQSEKDWVGGYQTLIKWHELESENQAVLYHLVLSSLIFEPEKTKVLIEDIQNPNFLSIQPDLEIILESDNPLYRLVIAGNALSKLGEWEHAAYAYSNVTRLDPDYAEGWAFYGNALYNSGSNGYFAFEKAITLSPKSKIARAYLASYWRNQNDFAKSFDLLNELIEEEPEQPVWYQEVGNTYIQAGNLDEALIAFQKSTELAPNDSYYWINLARFCGEYRVNINEIGIPAARQALVLDEQNWEVHDLIGWMYLLLNDYTSAERFLSNAFKFNPENALVNLHLGQLYSIQKRNELARYYLERSIRFSEDDEILELAQNFLSR
ncbi:MAG TPA: tetratricopeptide repeat protein [Anaerolineaceae bacterium]|nr:tetratricopeptide repeat protein [Anaerolineaceae bacterium]